ncbi:hypothetical protein N7467_001997 [Penicillium canescens]|nr:hypothetical protein N7467_001997 [Penicillium canescens]
MPWELFEHSDMPVRFCAIPKQLDLSGPGVSIVLCPLPITQPAPHRGGHLRPVMTVQANFITGGLILAFDGQHAVLDPQALGTFAQTWAKHGCAESDGLMVTASKRFSPDASDGSDLFGGHSSRSLSDFQTYWTVPECPFQETQRQSLRWLWWVTTGS